MEPVAEPPGEGAARPEAPAVSRRGPAALALHVLRVYSLVVLLAGSVGFYGLWGKTSEVFLTGDNLRNIAGSQAVLAMLTLGLLLPMISGNLDLSIGNVAGLSSIAAAAVFAHAHVPVVAGVLVGIAVGALAGLLNGLLITVLKVDSFIVTLGTASVITGVVNWYTDGLAIISGIPRSIITFGGGNLAGVPKSVYVLALVALAVYYLVEHTPYGRNLHAIGSNRAAARLVGIRVERSVLLAFVGSGTFAGIAGVVLLARSGAGNPQVGASFTLTAIAAAFLGAASFRPGRLNVPGTLVAIFFLAVNITGLTFAGVDNWINDLFTGLSLVLAIALASLLSRERRTR
ncbi:ABC transporter permease [Actinomadura scrupuli]|uniref:ABC transporter permease n=1 Tax=Actinomadura scrupuli TaxID=559629 RepID=UPI003D9A037F